MAEYIEREELIADIEKRYCRPCEAEGKDYNHIRCRACWVDDMVDEIEQAPAADVAPVVRCGECAMRDKKSNLTRTVYCLCLGRQMRKTEFCSCGISEEGE